MQKFKEIKTEVAIRCLIVLIIFLSVFSCKKNDMVENENPAPLIFNSKLTYGTMTDQEGNVYKTIKIGTQTWMAENLRTTKYNDGTPIPLVEQYYDWKYRRTPAYCWYNNVPANKSVYGALYNGYVVNTGKLAPVGWHVPTNDEWISMLNDAGGEFYAAPYLSELGYGHWLYKYDFHIERDNRTGFTALPAGYRDNKEFRDMGYLAYWWTSSRFETFEFNYVVNIYGNNGIITRTHESLDFGLSVRCVKDK